MQSSGYESDRLGDTRSYLIVLKWKLLQWFLARIVQGPTMFSSITPRMDAQECLNSRASSNDMTDLGNSEEY